MIESLADISSNAFLVFRSQMNDLDKRLGDIRNMPHGVGMWTRVVSGRNEYESIDNKQNTLQVGTDKRFGNFIIGAAASYTDAQGSLANGSTDDKNYSIGVYGSWIAESGHFFDFIVKQHHFKSDYSLTYLDRTEANGSLDTSGISISAEYGWRILINPIECYVEPQIEFMYGRISGYGYKTSNGVRVQQDAISSAVGRVGLAAGWLSPDKQGSAYAKLSYLKDWKANSNGKASKGPFTSVYHDDMSGDWVEYAVGGTYNFGKALAIYGEIETTSGSPVKTNYQAFAGLRYSF